MDDSHERGEESVTENLTQKTGAVNGAKARDPRRQRMEDLHAAACEISNPLRAGIRSAAADLLEIGYLLAAAIKWPLGAGATDLRQVEDVMPAINTLALLHRQTTRFVQVDRDWAAENDPDRTSKHRQRLPGNQAGEMES